MLRALLILLLAVYPFLVYVGLERFGPLALGSLLGALLMLRVLAANRLGAGLRMLAPLLAVLAFVVLVAVTGDERVLKSYPVLVNLALLILFGASLVHPPTVIERGLRLAGQTVPNHAGPYLRGVTLAWCGFFVLNAGIAAWTAYAAPLSWWTLWNGLLSYVLAGALFGVEFLVRGIYRRRLAGAGSHD